MTPSTVTLAARLREELADVQRVAGRVAHLVDRAVSSGDDAYWDALALNLHGFYTGLERIFEAIARELDGAVPGGPQSHRDLLVQMTAEVPGRRPAVLSRATRQQLDEYRGFRHLVRNVYSFSLRPERLEQLARALPTCLKAVQADLDAFLGFLEGTGEASHPQPEPGGG